MYICIYNTKTQLTWLLFFPFQLQTQQQRDQQKVIMKPVAVKDLDDKSGPYTIKVKVISKAYTQVSPNTKSLKYKRITFEDEQGTQIKTTLFNDDIEAYDPVIKEHMEYEISNAKLKPVAEQYKSSPTKHTFQLAFNNQTLIKAIEGSEGPTGPACRSINSIPKTLNWQDRFDVLGVVVFVEDIRQVTTHKEQVYNVREIVIVDQSSDQPLTITAWAELAITEGQALKEMENGFPIASFTHLKPSSHKGFSLATTTCTSIDVKPTGEKADTLKKWKDEQNDMLSNKHLQVSNVRMPQDIFVTITIDKLRAKKALDTMQEERHWLHVKAPEFDRKDVRFYLGCSNCGTRSNQEVEATSDCHSCKNKGIKSIPRINITFEAADKTGSYTFTAFTEDAEKLLEKGSHELYSMPPDDQLSYLNDIERKIRDTPFYIQVGPSSQLARSRVLKWVLKRVSLVLLY